MTQHCRRKANINIAANHFFQHCRLNLFVTIKHYLIMKDNIIKMKQKQKHLN